MFMGHPYTPPFIYTLNVNKSKTTSPKFDFYTSKLRLQKIFYFGIRALKMHVVTKKKLKLKNDITKYVVFNRLKLCIQLFFNTSKVYFKRITRHSV